MQRKKAIILIFILFNCHINVFAEVFQRSNMDEFKYESSKYVVATDTQAKRTENVVEKATDAQAKKADDTVENNNDTKCRIEDGTYSVSFPANIHAYLDPGNLSGKGQIFSDSYIIENYGSSDLLIKVKNIDINYWSDEYIYEFSEEAVTDKHSMIKKLNVNMIWENQSQNEKKVLNILDSEPNQYVLYLKAAEYNEDGEFIKLNNGSTGLFYFTGTLNSNPNIVWENGEITLSFDYEIISDKVDDKNDIIEQDKQEKSEEMKDNIYDGMNKEKTEDIIETNKKGNNENIIQQVEDLMEGIKKEDREQEEPDVIKNENEKSEKNEETIEDVGKETEEDIKDEENDLVKDENVEKEKSEERIENIEKEDEKEKSEEKIDNIKKENEKEKSEEKIDNIEKKDKEDTQQKVYDLLDNENIEKEENDKNIENQGKTDSINNTNNDEMKDSKEKDEENKEEINEKTKDEISFKFTENKENIEKGKEDIVPKN